MGEWQGPARPQDAQVERVSAFTDDDLAALCEAATAAILAGGAFRWVNPPERAALEAYFRGLLLVPERTLFLARLDGVPVGSAQLVRPSRHNEAQAFSATLKQLFLAPYARARNLRRMLAERVEERARAIGCQVLNAELREGQDEEAALLADLGYRCWGVHPAYARVRGRTLRGYYYYKPLQPGGVVP